MLSQAQIDVIVKKSDYCILNRNYIRGIEMYILEMLAIAAENELTEKGLLDADRVAKWIRSKT